MDRSMDPELKTMDKSYMMANFIVTKNQDLESLHTQITNIKDSF